MTQVSCSEYEYARSYFSRRVWFALGSDGIIYILGDCGDFDAADEVAKDILPEGINTLWILDSDTAFEWMSMLGEGGYAHHE